MAGGSYGFANGRVRVLEHNLMNRATLERMAAAATLQDLGRILAECGWGEAHTKQQIEKACENHVDEACGLIKSVSPEPRVTNCFLFKYDAMNLKLLLKARLLEAQHEPLSSRGTLEEDMLSRAVSENNYKDLPPIWKAAMERIEKRVALSPDPLYVDAQLDAAMFEMVQWSLPRKAHKDVRRYFAARADLANLLIALRSKAMGRGDAFAAELFVAGGDISPAELSKVAQDPERAIRATEGKAYHHIVKEALSTGTGSAQCSALEKKADDYLLGLLRPHRYEVGSLMPVVGYLVAREREASAVLLIATAKSARVPQEKVLERLRELYA